MSKTSPRWLGARILVGLLVCGTLTVGSASAQNLSTIQGRVQDSSGLPLVGALVAVQSVDSSIREFVFTNHLGVFSVPDLIAGRYLVRVTKSNFLPAVASNIDLNLGAEVALTLSLQTAMDIVRRGVRGGSLEEMKWVLRSAPSTRPILRLVEDTTDNEAGAAAVLQSTEASGYVQVYSTSMDASAGSSDSVGSHFSFSVPLALDSRVTFSGQYTEAANQPRGFGATYEFSSADRHRSSLAVSMRQGALLNGDAGGFEAREVQVHYDEQLRWSDDLVFDYGTSIGRAEGINGDNYIRPEFGVTWAPAPRTTLHGSFSRQTPEDTTDAIRGREYFDRSVYIPPELESYSHTEFGASQTLSEVVQVSAVVFRDRMGSQAFLVDSDDGRRAIVFFDRAQAASSGLRFSMDGTFRDFEASVGYTYANGVGFDPGVISPEQLREQVGERNFHVVTARFKTDIEPTRTSVTAVYRWASGFSLAPIDPYQRFAEYNDPTLSLTIAQDLPSLKILPAKVQAVVDARNLFEPSFGSRRTVHAGYPRLLKGGIHFKF
jgi:hypothetical protein